MTMDESPSASGEQYTARITEPYDTTLRYEGRNESD